MYPCCLALSLLIAIAQFWDVHSISISTVTTPWQTVLARRVSTAWTSLQRICFWVRPQQEQWCRILYSFFLLFSWGSYSVLRASRQAKWPVDSDVRKAQQGWNGCPRDRRRVDRSTSTLVKWFICRFGCKFLITPSLIPLLTLGPFVHSTPWSTSSCSTDLGMASSVCSSCISRHSYVTPVASLDRTHLRSYSTTSSRSFSPGLLWQTSG